MSPLLLAITLLATGPFIGNEQIWPTASRAANVTVATSAKGMLVSWNEGGRVRARFGGATLDLGIGSVVSVATDGSDFMVVWLRDGRAVGVRLGNPATLIDFGPTTKAPRVVWDGTDYRVFRGVSVVDSAAARSGAVVTTTFASMQAHWVCTNYWVTTACYLVPDIYSIDWNLTADGLGVANRIEQRGFMSSFAPGIGVGKDDFLIAWKSPVTVEGSRVLRGGSPAGHFVVPGAPGAKPMTGSGPPSVAWDGTRYLIVFDQVTATSDVWGAVIDPGRNYVAQPFVIAASEAQEQTPAVSALGPDRFLVAYGVGENGIGTRVVSFTEPPPSRRRAAH